MPSADLDFKELEKMTDYLIYGMQLFKNTVQGCLICYL